MTAISAFFMSFAAFASSAFAMSFDKLELASLMGSRNLLVILGVLILGLAGYMYLSSCGACCKASSKSSSSSSGKKMKKHHRAASADSKRNSSTSSIRKSPRKSKPLN